MCFAHPKLFILLHIIALPLFALPHCRLPVAPRYQVVLIQLQGVPADHFGNAVHLLPVQAPAGGCGMGSTGGMSACCTAPLTVRQVLICMQLPALLAP